MTQTSMATTEEILKSIYYDVTNPASFSSVDSLLREARQRSSAITRKDVENFLSSQLTYTLHRQIRRKFRRNPVITNNYEELAQADLIDVTRYKEANEGMCFILTMIDVFTKVAFAVPIKNKSGPVVAAAIQTILREYKPFMLQTDEGREFLNKQVQHLLTKRGVHFYTAKNERIKCAVVERFQRTLLTKMHKYFTSKGTVTFTDVLPNLMHAYNNTFHRSIKMTPNQAKVADPDVVFKNLYGARNERELIKGSIGRRVALTTGQTVRIPEQKNPFAKGYLQNFTDEIYRITSVNKSQKVPTFVISDYKGQRVPGTFYPQEVQKVKDNETYRVVVLGERRRGRGKQFLVRYVNFPDYPEEWIAGSRLKPIA